MKILASIRLFLAYLTDTQRLGTMMTDIIEKHILPKVEEMTADDPEEQEALMSAFENMARYPDAGQVMGSIINVSKTFGLGETDISELVQSFIVDVYRLKSWEKFGDIGKGPKAFVKFVSGIATRNAMYRARELSRQRRREPSTDVPGLSYDDDPVHPGTRDVVDLSVTDPSDVLHESEQEIVREMTKFVRPRLGPKAKLVYDYWIGKLSEGNWDPLRMTSAKTIKEVGEMLGISKSSLGEHIIAIKNVVGEFFRREYGMNVVASSNLPVIERVAQGEWRRRVARWVLGNTLEVGICQHMTTSARSAEEGSSGGMG